MKRLLWSLLFLLSAFSVLAQQQATTGAVMVTNATGVLIPGSSNFFVANSNLVNAVVVGGGNATNAIANSGGFGTNTTLVAVAPNSTYNGPQLYSSTNNVNPASGTMSATSGSTLFTFSSGVLTGVANASSFGGKVIPWKPGFQFGSLSDGSQYKVLIVSNNNTQVYAVAIPQGSGAKATYTSQSFSFVPDEAIFSDIGNNYQTMIEGDGSISITGLYGYPGGPNNSGALWLLDGLLSERFMEQNDTSDTFLSWGSVSNFPQMVFSVEAPTYSFIVQSNGVGEFRNGLFVGGNGHTGNLAVNGNATFSGNGGSTTGFAPIATDNLGDWTWQAVAGSGSIASLNGVGTNATLVTSKFVAPATFIPTNNLVLSAGTMSAASGSCLFTFSSGVITGVANEAATYGVPIPWVPGFQFGSLSGDGAQYMALIVSNDNVHVYAVQLPFGSGAAHTYSSQTFSVAFPDQFWDDITGNVLGTVGADSSIQILGDNGNDSNSGGLWLVNGLYSERMIERDDSADLFLAFGSVSNFPQENFSVEAPTYSLTVESNGVVGAKYGVSSPNGYFTSFTYTAPGTTGAQTINKCAGDIRIAASGTSVVLTDSQITANSRVFAQLCTVDATAKSVSASQGGTGSCTFTLNAAATAEVQITFNVLNGGQ